MRTGFGVGVGFVLVVGLGAVACAGGGGATCDTEGCGSSSGSGGTGAMTTAVSTTMTTTAGGDGMTAGPGTGSASGATSGVDTSASGTADSGTGAGGCGSDGDCTDSSAPFCVDSVCVPCDQTDDPGAACAGADPSTPLCVSGGCVACTDAPDQCGGVTPVCDDASGACVACTEHSQCPDSGCHAFVGSCIDPTTVLYVDGGASAGGDGTMGMPFQTITDAVAAVPSDSEATILVEQTIGMYNEAVVVDGGRVLAIFGNGGAQPQLRSPSAAPGLDVSGMATVYLDHFDVLGNGLDDTTRATDSGLDLRHCFLDNNSSGHGIDASNADIRVDHTEITRMHLGGITATGSDVTLLTTLVAGNGTFGQPTTGLFAEDTTFSMNYTSMVNNFGGGSMAGTVETTIECRGSSDGQVRNSILLAPNAEQIDTTGCPMLVVDNSAVDTMGLGGTDSVVVTYDTAYFVNPFAPNFHLDPAYMGSPFENLALWQDGDPATDYDGDARPDMDGTPDWAGYDIPQ